MDKQKDFYNKRYLNGYRGNLNGYEIARWVALEHFIKNILKLEKIKNVLDYGCGNGLHINLWKKLFTQADFNFCDISNIALEALINKYPEFKNKCFEVGKNRTLTIDSYFDLILSIEVIEHVENLDNYLNDIFRLLKPGGFFIWTTPCANVFSIEHIYNVLTKQIETTIAGERRWKWEDPAHLRRLKSYEIKNKLKKIGFESIKFRFRAHLFSFLCSYFFTGRLRRIGEKVMLLDYYLFRKFPNGASMIGVARKSYEKD